MQSHAEPPRPRVPQIRARRLQIAKRLAYDSRKARSPGDKMPVDARQDAEKMMKRLTELRALAAAKLRDDPLPVGREATTRLHADIKKYELEKPSSSSSLTAIRSCRPVRRGQSNSSIGSTRRCCGLPASNRGPGLSARRSSTCCPRIVCSRRL